MKNTKNFWLPRLGFMQGRLSPLIDNKIQSFPWHNWKNEFSKAEKLGLKNMEWTLDHEFLHENPLLTANGQKQIRYLCELHNIKIPSLTGDCFMQQPFWKHTGNLCKELQKDFLTIVESCVLLDIKLIVIPLVDNGKIVNTNQMDNLTSFLLNNLKLFRATNQKIVFESDFSPKKLSDFIKCLPPDVFGINYDIGNSASLGYKPLEEFEMYGTRVYNVHIKDRCLNQSSVPLGKGDANFLQVFHSLEKVNYQGNYIFQTARSKTNNHCEALADSINFVANIVTTLSSQDKYA